MLPLPEVPATKRAGKLRCAQDDILGGCRARTLPGKSFTPECGGRNPSPLAGEGKGEGHKGIHPHPTLSPQGRGIQRRSILNNIPLPSRERERVRGSRAQSGSRVPSPHSFPVPCALMPAVSPCPAAQVLVSSSHGGLRPKPRRT